MFLITLFVVVVAVIVDLGVSHLLKRNKGESGGPHVEWVKVEAQQPIPKDPKEFLLDKHLPGVPVTRIPGVPSKSTRIPHVPSEPSLFPAEVS